MTYSENWIWASKTPKQAISKTDMFRTPSESSQRGESNGGCHEAITWLMQTQRHGEALNRL